METVTFDQLYHNSHLGSASELSFARIPPSRPFHSTAPIVLDIGSWEARIGDASRKDPSACFRSLSKTRNRKAGEEYDPIGHFIHANDSERLNLKTPFEKQVISNHSLLESLLDYSFESIGITENSVNRPILFTECFGNPSFSRDRTAELLFECYGVPSVSFGISSLFSHSYNSPSASSSLLMDISNEATTIIPIYRGSPMHSQTLRLDIGGNILKEYLQSFMQLKYPQHFTAVAGIRGELLFHSFAKTALDYSEKLERIEARDESDGVILQLDYDRPQVMTEEEILEQKAKRKVLAERMREIAVQKRQEKLTLEKETLRSYDSLLSEMEDGAITAEEFKAQLVMGGFESLEDFKVTRDELCKSIEKKEGTFVEEVVKETFDLVDIPDEQLTETQLKRKRMQKMAKGAAEARAKKKIEEERERLEEQFLFDSDPQKFIDDLVDRVKSIEKSKADRLKVKEDLGNRNSSARKQRLRTVASLGALGEVDDGFGADDGDWDVYRTICDGNESEEENEELNRLRKKIDRYDPDRVYQSEEVQQSDADQLEKYYQMYFGVERFRCTEPLFQPSLIGSDSAGISEILEIMHQRVSHSDVFDDIFITGGLSCIDGIKERIYKETRMILSYGRHFQVRRAGDPIADGWRGAAQFALSDEFEGSLFTKAEFEEYGRVVLKKSRFSNIA